MSENVTNDVLKDALRKRRKYIESNLDNLTMKACRKLLEEDLGMPDKALADRKAFIQKYIDKIIDQAEEKKTGSNSKRDKKKPKKAPAAKKHKALAEEDDDDRAQPSAQPRTSKTIDKVKQICKAATIKIPPSMYVKTKSLSQVEEDMKALLEKHDLSLGSSSHEISKAANRLAKERDLEGIDVSNIVQGGRRARRAAAVAAPINYAAIDQSGSSSDDDNGAEDSGASSSQDQSSDEAEQHDASEDEAESNDEEDQQMQNGSPDTNGIAHDAADANKAGKLADLSTQGAVHNMEDSDAEHGNTKKRKAVLYDSDDE